MSRTNRRNYVCTACRLRYRTNEKCSKCAGPLALWTWGRIPPRRDVRAWAELAESIRLGGYRRLGLRIWIPGDLTNHGPRVRKLKTWRGITKAAGDPR